MQQTAKWRLGQCGPRRLQPGNAKAWMRPAFGHRGRSKFLCHAGVKVEFHMPYRTQMGDHLAVVGAGEVLGDWTVEKSFALNWTEGDEWVGMVEVPAGCTLEYKYIVVRGDGNIEWSPGNNYMLEVVNSNGATMGIYEGWVKDGPRHVNITEPNGNRAGNNSGPAVERSSSPDSPQKRQLVSNMVNKLNTATERLLRVEYEAIVSGLLSQHPDMTADQLHIALPALMPQKAELSLDQVESLLASMVRQEKLTEERGKFRLHPQSRFHAHGGEDANEEDQEEDEEDQEDSDHGVVESVRESPSRRPAPPQPARFASPTSPAATPHPAPSARSARTDGTPANVLQPAVMKLLEVYSGMTLERLHKVLGNGAVADYSSTPEQLEALLAQLQQAGRVILQNGVYRKGMATPSPSRRPPPQPTRAPRSHAVSPAPAQAQAQARVAPAAAPAPAQAQAQAQARVAPAAAPARRTTQSAPATAQSPGASNLSAYEQRALSLLSNYSGCTVDRLFGQLQASTDFPGSVADLDTILHKLAAEGRVKDEGGVYRYISTRSATPTASRGVTTTPTRVPHAAPARGGSADRVAPAPAPSRAPTPGAARGADVPIDHLVAYEQRALSILANYSGCTVERLYGQLKAAIDFPGTQQELGAMLRKLTTEGRVKDANGIYSYVSQRSATPTGARMVSPRPLTPTPARPGSNGSSNGTSSAQRQPASAPQANVTIDHLLPYEQRLLSILSNYSGCTMDRLFGQLQATIDFPGTQQELGAMLKKLVRDGRVQDDSGVFRYISTRSATPTGARSARAAAPNMSGRATSPLPARPRVSGSTPVPGTNGQQRNNISRSSLGGIAAQTAYSLFCEEFRPAVKAKYPAATPADLAHILATEWQSVLPSTRARYERMASNKPDRSPTPSRA